MIEAQDPDGSGASPIPVSRYSTDTLLPHADAHAAWAARGFPSVAGVFRSEPIGAFATEADQIDFDGLVLQFAGGTARRFERSALKARADGLDLLGVGIQLDGIVEGEARGRGFVAPPGALLLLDLAEPAWLTMPASRSIQLGVPRAMAEEHLGPVRRLHGMVVAPVRAAMLVGHLHQLRDALPHLTEWHRPRLARTVLDLLALAVDRGPPVAPACPRERPTLAIVKREIEARLGLPSLTVASLCQRLRLSRSALYRLFEAEGGVESYIRRRRLEQVRTALADAANRDRIGDLAYRWGFSDAAHLSRQFRETYGRSPRHFRAEARG